jgi:hypothetical protein
MRERKDSLDAEAQAAMKAVQGEDEPLLKRSGALLRDEGDSKRNTWAIGA